MQVAVIGGKLQGVEAVYLARKAGWETLVIDRNPAAPAVGMCDHFLEFQFSLQQPVPKDCPKVNLIIPAVEDIDTLIAVKMWAEKENIPFAFDLDAYKISNSKLTSNTLFQKMSLTMPSPWPGCGLPFVVKPAQASGSEGVKVFYDSKAFLNWFSAQQKMDDIVIQEYIEGPSYSIEVVGFPGRYQALQVTDLSMDNVFDCKRVTAPTALEFEQICRFKKMALAIAEEIQLKGIMDVEVVLNKDELKLLEIDARLPSQTPMAVYWSTGINMVEVLGDFFLNDDIRHIKPNYERFVVVEHLRVSGDSLEICGEHIMTGEGPLTIRKDFLGADEALTSFSSEKKCWVATLIFAGDTFEHVAVKRQNCYEQVYELFHRSCGDNPVSNELLH